jgi:tetratricopeptide (TPR) repeat protein
MSRFGSLELGDESGDQLQAEPVLKDEAHYLSEAKGAFESADFAGALRSYSKALEFNPQNATAWTGQVRALIELGEFPEAKVWAEKALERFPRDPDLLAAKAVALGRSGDLDAAMAFSDAAIEERGETAYIWLARGDVLLARKESRADYCFEKALMLAPGDWCVAWLAARIRYFYQQFVAALKLLQQALEWNTTQFVLWLELGQCQLALGMGAAAERSFNQARQLNPECRLAAQGLARAADRGVWSGLSGAWRRWFRR